MEDATLALEALEAELAEHPTAFDFFQAVQLLERLRPDRTVPGGVGDPSRETVRFSVHRSISFPPSEIRSLEIGADGPAEMSVNFMGLIGPLGVLPYHYTQLAADRSQKKDPALADFLDLFHHRILSLFYRAWRKNRFWAGREDDADPLREHVLDLGGVGLEGLRQDLPFDEDVLVYYAGLLSSPRRSAVALEQLLSDYFEVPAKVEQFVGGWHELPHAEQCALGEEATPSTRLGGGAVVGDEIWDQQSGVRIRLGPLTRRQYDSFLPTGDAFQELRALTRYFANGEHEFELQLVLARDEVEGCVLGSEVAAQPLGWATWIRTQPFPDDADDTVLRL